MKTYVVQRLNAWRNPDDLHVAGMRSTNTAAVFMPHEVRWIRSYVVQHADGTLGSFCVYEATGDEALLAHARRANLPVDEILPVVDTVVVRPDPQTASAPRLKIA